MHRLTALRELVVRLGAPVIAIFLLGSPLSVRAADELTPQALLDGQPIPLVQVGEHNCTDVTWPVITCFGSPAELEDFIALQPMATQVSIYIKWCSNVGFSSPCMSASQEYRDLRTIG